MSHSGWQTLVKRVRQVVPGVSEHGPVVPSGRAGQWLLLTLGLALAWLVGWGLVVLNHEAARLGKSTSDQLGATSLLFRDAWAVPSESVVFPAQLPGKVVSLPDEWARSQPDHEGAVWYRFHFDTATRGILRGDLLGVYVGRACSSVEVYLNGQMLYRGGSMSEPVARQCLQSHVVPLPDFLLRPGDNQLDLRVVGFPLQRVTARQRAGGLAEVRVGPLDAMQRLHREEQFWSTTMSQMIAAVLIVLGLFALLLAWVRRLGYLLYFGLLNVGWALLTGRLWQHEVPWPNAISEGLFAALFAPMAAFAVCFLLDYSGAGMREPRARQIERVVQRLLWWQCLLMPLSLWVAGVDHLFLTAGVWYACLSLEVFGAIGYFLWHAGRARRPEFWLMSSALGVVAAVLGIELSFQTHLVQVWGIHVTYFVMPLLYAAVAFRLTQVYARALDSAESARTQLERRVQEISAEIERNFNQIAELRVEQIAEKERKRIAADLHDDLGAKLLTIVHTSDNDRISGLAREALDEMRLSVRGLTGRAMVLSNALADWRAEVVSRLGQAGIEIEWRNAIEEVEEPLSARTYVQTTRILREAVSNIIKHSGASHVMIHTEVHLDDRQFLVIIQDNGRGIPMELDGRLDRGHGMTTMKHRAKQLSGQCLVESGPGFGTVIRLTLPLDLAPGQQAGGLSLPRAADTASIGSGNR